MEKSVQPEVGQGKGSQRKPYVAPSLVEYGSIAKLTQGTTGSGTDGSSMMARLVML